MRKYLIHILGGYISLDDAIEDVDRHAILTEVVKKLYNTINEEDILRLDEQGNWIFEGKVLDKAVQGLICAEATQLLDSKLWQILKADVQYMANKKMYFESKTETDLIAGKLFLFALDVIKTRLKSMRKESPVFNLKK